MTRVYRPAVGSVLCLFGLLVATGLLVPRAATAQDAETPCNVSLSVAESRYLNGNFDDTIELLNRCLSDPALSGIPSQQQAFILLGRAYYAKGLEDQAKSSLEELLVLVPEYQPDPQFPPSFRRLIEEVRTELQLAGRLPVEEAQPAEEPEIVPPSTTTTGRRPIPRWVLYGGGGALAAGVTAAILLSGGGGGGNGTLPPVGFPFPPGRPN